MAHPAARQHARYRRACEVCFSHQSQWVIHWNIGCFCMLHMLNTVAAKRKVCLVPSGVCAVEIDLAHVTFSDKSWFLLSGYVNSQNNRFWCVQNSMLIYEVPLHDAVFGVWCAPCAAGFVGPILHSRRYVHSDVVFEYCSIMREPVFLLSKTLNSSHRK
jgi:hypothetical protein